MDDVQAVFRERLLHRHAALLHVRNKQLQLNFLHSQYNYITTFVVSPNHFYCNNLRCVYVEVLPLNMAIW